MNIACVSRSGAPPQRRQFAGTQSKTSATYPDKEDFFEL
jgi:hypothetical protein